MLQITLLEMTHEIDPTKTKRRSQMENIQGNGKKTAKQKICSQHVVVKLVKTHFEEIEQKMY